MAEVPTSWLSAQAFLRGMPDAQVTQLAAAAVHVSFTAGYRLFEEGGTARRFWLIDAGSVALDLQVPAQGRVTIETLGRGELVGWSWLFPPFQWSLGAVTVQRAQAFEFDAPAVRKMCEQDPELGYALTRRVSAVLARRLKATRLRLIEAHASLSG